MKNTIVIMSKIPYPGQTKTRLMTMLTGEECAAFHLACLNDTLNTVKSTGIPGYVYWSCQAAGHVPPVLPTWDDYNFQEKMQRGNNLGERMLNIVEDTLTQYQAVLLIGSDIPEINREILKEAFLRLQHVDVVVGPALDGGYYLLALKKNCPDLFNDIPWSTPAVLEKTLQAVKDNGLTYSLVASRQDIDTWEDLLAYYRRGRTVEETYGRLHSYKYTELLLKKYLPPKKEMD